MGVAREIVEEGKSVFREKKKKKKKKVLSGGSLGEDGFNVCAVLARRGWPLVVVVAAGK